MARKYQKLAKLQRRKMINEVAVMILKNKKRDDIVNFIVDKYQYSPKTTNDLICEAQAFAARKFTDEEVDLAKRQIYDLTQEIMNDEDEIGLSKLRAAELLGKLMKAFQPDVAIQNNTMNLNLSNLTTEELKQILGGSNE